jgi:hypothetical protein
VNPFSNISYQGQSISPNALQSFQLTSGATYVIPYGVFLAKPGPQTAIQFKDYNSGLWKNFGSGPNDFPVYIGSDGTNYRAINLSGTINGATVTTPGTGYTQSGTTIAFAAPSSGVTATGTPIIGGSLTATVISGGSGYVNPIVLIDPPQVGGGTPGLCIPATARVGLTAGVISSITFDFAGAGYVGIPNITILDAAGTGAVITAAIANGTATNGGLTGIVMTNYGSGYDGTHIPAITITGPTGSSATAAATALPNLALTGVTVGGTNTGYTASVIVESSLGAPLNIFGDTVLPRPARATIAQSGGVLGTATIEDAGIGFQTVPLLKQVGNATADGSVTATFTAVVGGVNNTLTLWQIG